MRKALIMLLMTVAGLQAQTIKQAIHLAPNGKGWGVERKAAIGIGTPANQSGTTNGIFYHGGR